MLANFHILISGAGVKNTISPIQIEELSQSNDEELTEKFSKWGSKEKLRGLFTASDKNIPKLSSSTNDFEN